MRAPIQDMHPSNLLTYTSLAAALGAMAAAGGRGGAALAGALLAIAALADTFDGRFARCFTRSERQRRVGRELDSLVDIVSFGVAPVVVLAKLAPPEGTIVASVWWIAAFERLQRRRTRCGLRRRAGARRRLDLGDLSACGNVALGRCHIVHRGRRGDGGAAGDCAPAAAGSRGVRVVARGAHRAPCVQNSELGIRNLFTRIPNSKFRIPLGVRPSNTDHHRGRGGQEEKSYSGLTLRVLRVLCGSSLARAGGQGREERLERRQVSQRREERLDRDGPACRSRRLVGEQAR